MKRLLCASLLLLVAAAPAVAQGTVDNRSLGKQFPWRVISFEPGVCDPGEVYWNSVTGMLRRCNDAGAFEAAQFFDPAKGIVGTDIDTPANPPPSGQTFLYPKGGKWCTLSPSSVENCTGGTGGGGGATIATTTHLIKGDNAGNGIDTKVLLTPPATLWTIAPAADNQTTTIPAGTLLANTRAVNTTAPLAGGGALSADLTLTCAVASGSQPGCLASADWTTFNNKVPTTTTVNGHALSANVTVSATDISTGTLPAAQLPNPSASTLGGVESLAVVSHKWINTISTAGVPAATQPACGDLSDASAACSSLTNLTLVTPTLGVATVTSVNKVGFTAPATAATFAFGTDNATITFQGTDTYVGRATTDTLTNKTLTLPVISSISNGGTVTIPSGADTLVARTSTDTLTNKTLTSPKITTVLDANGNPFVLSSATASAVDSITVTNAATANPATVTIKASGSDSNVNLELDPKGTGKVNLGSTNATVDTSGNLVVVGCTGCGAGTGTVTVVGAGSLTSTALVTGGGSQALQTPAATATMDSSGNISTPGSIKAGAGGSVAGYLQLGQGTLPSNGTTAVQFVAPTGVTSYQMVMPAAAGTGFILNTDASNTETWSFVGSTGSGNVVRATSPTLVTPALGTPSAVVLTNATGFPATIVQTNQANTYSTGAQDFTAATSILVTTQSAGDSSTKAASTSFVGTAVTNAIAAVNPAVAVQAASAAILPNSPTYSNGVSGVGATLTSGSNAALVVDGYTVLLNDRVLVKNQATAANNGVYTQTTLGTGSVPWVLTRAGDFNQPSDMNNTGAIPVVNGTANTSTQWLLTSKVTTVGTDAVTFTEFALNPTSLVTSASPGAGIARFAGSTQAVTSAELSGDCTTSGSNAVTCLKTNGTSFGTASTQNTGTSGATIPLLNGANTWSGANIFGGGDLFNGGIDAQSGTSYTVLAADENKLLTFNNGSAVAVTLPQATTAGFTVGAVFTVFNRGAGAVTITPTTSTINGGSTVVLNQNQGAEIVSDGTNYSAWISSAPSGSGTVTSVAQSFTGGLISVGGSPITTSGTLALTVAGTSGGIPYFSSSSGWASSGALTANGVVLGGGAGSAPTVTSADSTTTHALFATAGAPAFRALALSDLPKVPWENYSPAANCVNAVAGSAWSTAATPASLCRAGTNNKSGELSPWGGSDVGYIQFPIYADADVTTTLPYLMLEVTSTDATNGHTVIMQESVACAKLDGSTTDDVAFNAARSFATVTLNGNANRTWDTTLQLNSTDLTGCAAPGVMWVKISRTTDTATNVGIYGLRLTQFRTLTAQAN